MDTGNHASYLYVETGNGYWQPCYLPVSGDRYVYWQPCQLPVSNGSLLATYKWIQVMDTGNTVGYLQVETGNGYWQPCQLPVSVDR